MGTCLFCVENIRMHRRRSKRIAGSSSLKYFVENQIINVFTGSLINVMPQYGS